MWKCKTLLYGYKQLHGSCQKTDDIYKDSVEDVETKLDTSNYELDRPLSKEKNRISNWINERWIRGSNHERICRIKSKNI